MYMLYNQRHKRIPQILLKQLLVSIGIIFVALALIIYSQGYRVNWQYLRLYKTGLIYLNISPRPDKIIVGCEEFNGKEEFAQNSLPGDYHLVIKKSGYVDWNGEIKVESEVVTSYKNIKLFKENPELALLTDQSKIEFLNAPETVLAENARGELAFNKYEIWVNGSLVTRFSKEITNVSWYPDMKHILFQQGAEIRVIEDSGFNNTLLAKLSSDKQTRFAVGNREQELYFLDDGIYKKAIIRQN